MWLVREQNQIEHEKGGINLEDNREAKFAQILDLIITILPKDRWKNN